MRRSRRNTNALTSIAYAAVAVAGLGGLGYAAYNAYDKPVMDEFGCFAGHIRSERAVLVDASEPRWNKEQQRSLRRYLDQYLGALPFNIRLSFFTTEGDAIGSVLAPRFHVCGTAKTTEDLEAIGADSASAGYLAKSKQRLYEDIVQPEFNAFLALEPDEQRRQLYQSPILEMIQSLSQRADFHKTEELVLISDLIHNSDSAQFCRVPNDMPSFAAFKNRRVYQRLKPESLEGIKVELLMLQRDGYGADSLRYCRNEEEIANWWEDYFLGNGAAEVRIVRIRTGGTGG